MAKTRHDRAKDAVLETHLERLREAETVMAAAAEQVSRARALRNEVIRSAVDAGLSLRQVSGAVGLSPEGVNASLGQSAPIYDSIGATYARTRQPDPRIRDRIWAAIGDAKSVVNVGAGAGSYEPPQTLLAVEPSMVMIAQRPAGLAPAAVTTAERIPLPDKSVDVALCSLTIHHWPDFDAGLAEIRRVARKIVIFTWDFDVSQDFWLCDYIPAINDADQHIAVPVAHLREVLNTNDVTPVPVPHDCQDGFLGAYWRRPQMYLDPLVRAGISTLSKLDQHVVRAGLETLLEDLQSGAWQQRYGSLMGLDDLDIGYRLVVADLD
ncbi:MAG: class I SAM-dependent methyltransferase [Dehalococcoidia bacterium]